MFFRFILVNIFSFVKRFFAFNAILYKIIIFIPLLTVFTKRISKKSLFFVIYFSIIFLITGNLCIYSYYIMFFLLLLAVPMFEKISFEGILSKSIFFFILVSLYGISQKYLGYSFVELNWIRSGLSVAHEESFFITDEIRPFSTFASIPEFTLFISLFLFYFTHKKNIILIIFSLIMLYIAGSRGVIVSTLVAYLFTFLIKKYNFKFLFFSFLLSFFIYLVLIFIFPYIIYIYIENDSRMLVYGTFNGRIELLINVLEQSSIYTLIKGSNTIHSNIGNTFDNIYLMLITNFGILGCIYFIYFFIKQKFDKKSFYFISIFIGYGFYADMVYSYYLMFLFFFAIYSNNEKETFPKITFKLRGRKVFAI